MVFWKMRDPRAGDLGEVACLSRGQRGQTKGGDEGRSRIHGGYLGDPPGLYGRPRYPFENHLVGGPWEALEEGREWSVFDGAGLHTVRNGGYYGRPLSRGGKRARAAGIVVIVR